MEKIEGGESIWNRKDWRKESLWIEKSVWNRKDWRRNHFGLKIREVNRFETRIIEVNNLVE